MSTSTITLNAGDTLTFTGVPPKTLINVQSAATGDYLNFQLYTTNCTLRGFMGRTLAYELSPTAALASPQLDATASADPIPILLGDNVYNLDSLPPGDPDLYDQMLSHKIEIPKMKFDYVSAMRLSKGDENDKKMTHHADILTMDIKIQTLAPLTVGPISAAWNPVVSSAPPQYNTTYPLYLAFFGLVLAILGFAFRSTTILARVAEAFGVIAMLFAGAWRAYQYYLYKE